MAFRQNTVTTRITVAPKKDRNEDKKALTAFRQQLGQQADTRSAIEDKIQELFTAFDENQNGFISIEELKQGLLRWGVKLNKPNTELLLKSFAGAENSNFAQFREIMLFFIKLRQNFTKFDVDSSNTIDHTELVGFLSSFQYGFDSSFMIKFLKFFDTDKSGELDWQEMVELMLYVHYLHQLFAKEDQEKDGVLSPAELQAILRALDMHATVTETDVFLRRMAPRLKSGKGMNFEIFVELLLDMKENLDAIRIEALKERQNARVPRVKDEVKRGLPVTAAYQDNLKKHMAKVDAILKKCKQNSKKFEDPEFPADEQHLFPKRKEALRSVHCWKRIQDFGPNAELFKDGIDQGDVKQGALGDCWLLSSLCVLAAHGNSLIKDLFFETYPEYGIIQCQFFKDGEWYFVVTDDRIPCNVQGRPSFGTCRDPNELWVPVLEKCYAKLHGSYEALESGSISDGLVDLTGECSETLDLKKEDALWHLLLENLKEGYLMGCAAHSPTATVEMETPLGILMLHAYGILGAYEISGHRLLKIRNPWGNHEWKGRWSDGSKEWTPEIKAKLGAVFEDDGTFYMEFSDFCKNFNKMYVLRMLSDEIGITWKRHDFKSEWKGETAAGCPNFPAWAKNPQFHVRSPTTSRVFVSLRQPCMRLKTREKPKYPFAIGFVVFLKGDSSDEQKQKRGAGDLVGMTAFFSGREISLEFEAKANIDYVIIPSHFNPGEENAFNITVYTVEPNAHVCKCTKPTNSGTPVVAVLKSPNDLTTLSCNSSWVKGKTAGGCTNEPTWKQSPQFILEIPQDDKVTITVKQLQKVDGKYLHCGFIVMKAEKTKKRKYVVSDVVHQSQFVNSLTNEAEVPLQAGAYNIFASTFHPNLENTFELSVAGSNKLKQGKLYELTHDNDWRMAVLNSKWSPGKEGGCSNNKTTWMQNPTFCVEIPQPTNIKILVDVISPLKTAVGYYLFSSKDGKKVTRMIGASSFVQGAKSIAVVKDWEIVEAGKYLIIVTTFEPKHHAPFTLTVLSESDVLLTEV
eukprot:TRINITY_DN3847_c0_g1_i1.p1 TRINITY_DN3847_c0_g1~~TRINITY_DN3847_c0_g1_i1.p1  ORF type:complete len:1025 (-),score=208.60 TRINITY_DN3847_c0_g1_i1:50-3124(-)